MQGIYQGCELLPGDVPLTVALDLSMRDSYVASLSTAYHILSLGGNAAVIRL